MLLGATLALSVTPVTAEYNHQEAIAAPYQYKPAPAPAAGATGTDYYFPGKDIGALEEGSIPNSCFFKAWYAGSYMAHSDKVIQGSGNNPDSWVGYWPAKFKLPVGSTLILKGRYPNARYQSVDTYAGPIPVDAIASFQIEPDEGSTNPMKVGSDRTVDNREWTLKMVPGLKPAKPAKNTLYLQPENVKDPKDLIAELRYRVYFPDRGRDVLGDVPLPWLHELQLADGTVVKGEENICAKVNMNLSMGAMTETSFDTRIWKNLVKLAPNPARAPAQDTPNWERMFTIPYSILGQFLLPDGKAKRAEIPLPKPTKGGGGGLTGTQANSYVFTYLSHETPEREVAVTKLKVANTPKTFMGGKTTEVSGGPIQAQYWSFCSNVDLAGLPIDGKDRSVPSGTRQSTCHNDETVVLNKDRFTRIVVTPADKRPKNATNACGWSWMAAGEPDLLGRPITTLVLRPGLNGEEGFTQNSSNILKPGTEAEVMGDYMPKTEYMSVEDFEALGCNKDGFEQQDGHPDLPSVLWGTNQNLKPHLSPYVIPTGQPVPETFKDILMFLKNAAADSAKESMGQ
jgi:hypothetical protein